MRCISACFHLTQQNICLFPEQPTETRRSSGAALHEDERLRPHRGTLGQQASSSGFMKRAERESGREPSPLALPSASGERPPGA